MNTAKLNIPKLIQACERHYHWKHVVYLYTHYDEFDQAAYTMMAYALGGDARWRELCLPWDRRREDEG